MGDIDDTVETGSAEMISRAHGKAAHHRNELNGTLCTAQRAGQQCRALKLQMRRAFAIIRAVAQTNNDRLAARGRSGVARDQVTPHHDADRSYECT